MSVPFRARGIRSWLSVTPLEDRTTPTAVLTENFGSFAADRVLVTLDSPADLGVLTTSPLAQSVRQLGGNAYLVSLNSGVGVGQAVTTFSVATGVLFAEPDYDIGVRLVPNDPSFGQLWGLHNTGQNGGTPDADIDAPEAWDTARGTGRTVVGIIDTGVDYTHPDLYLNIWLNQGEIPTAVRATLADVDGDGRISFRDLNASANAGRLADANGNGRIDAGDAYAVWSNGLDDSGNGVTDDFVGYDYANGDANPFDDNSHGTHVAGTIGAIGNNGVGVAGVAWTATIMPLKFLAASGGGSTSGAISAISYAVANGARILNNSWGGGGFSSSLFNAIANANASGVIFVAAAGNSASNNDSVANYPSNYNLPNVVAVASTTNTNGLSSFSNYGATQVDLGAPGQSIYSTVPGGYATYNGTSMATPHVAGALAVYWDANPGKTAAEVIQKLLSSTDPLASLAGKTVTGGRLNLFKMLTGTVPPPPMFDSGARVTSGVFSGATGTLSNLRLTFSEAINAATFDASDVTLTGPGGTIATTVTQVNATTFDVAFAAQSAYGTYGVTVGPDILDTAQPGNAMNQDDDQTNGEATADRYTTSAALNPPSQTFTYTSNTTMAIRDLRTQTASLVVPTVAGVTNVPFADLNVRVNLTHTWVGDLRLTLIAPNGTRVQLFNRRGGSGNNLTSTTFNDEAATAISAGAAPFSGSFRPEQLLSALDGLNAVGTWKLEIADLAGGDVGTLLNWSLVFTTGTPQGGQSVQTFAFREADPDAPTEVKSERVPDSAAPRVVICFAEEAADSPITVTAPTADPITAPTVAPPAEPTAETPVSPPPVVEVAEPMELPPVAELPTPTPVSTPTANTTPAYTVDMMSFLSLFRKTDDPFAPVRL